MIAFLECVGNVLNPIALTKIQKHIMPITLGYLFFKRNYMYLIDYTLLAWLHMYNAATYDKKKPLPKYATLENVHLCFIL